jgi:hypothetical protein
MTLRTEDRQAVSIELLLVAVGVALMLVGWYRWLW